MQAALCALLERSGAYLFVDPLATGGEVERPLITDRTLVRSGKRFYLAMRTEERLCG